MSEGRSRHARTVGEREPERQLGDRLIPIRRLATTEVRSRGRRVDAEWPLPEVPAVVANGDPERLGEPSRPARQRGEARSDGVRLSGCRRRGAIARIPARGSRARISTQPGVPAGPAMAFRQAWRP